MCFTPVLQCGPSTGVQYTPQTAQVSHPPSYDFSHSFSSNLWIVSTSFLLFVDVGYKQYLAVGPLPTSTHAPDVGVKVARPFPACIQIWSLAPTQPVDSLTSEDDRGVMRCEMVLCVDCGPAYTLRWCPLPTHDKVRISDAICKSSFQ